MKYSLLQDLPTWSRTLSETAYFFPSLSLYFLSVFVLFPSVFFFGIAQLIQWLGYGLDERGSIPGRERRGIFSPRRYVQTGSGTHSASSTLLYLGLLSPGVKRLGREANHSAPSSAELKDAWSYASAFQYNYVEQYLVKHTDNCNFKFTLPYLLLT
jgi:hypothetical protein